MRNCYETVGDTTAEDDLVNEVKELTDIIGDGGYVGIGPLEVLLVNFADPLHAFVDRLVVRVGPGLRLDARLNQQDGVSHGE